MAEDARATCCTKSGVLWYSVELDRQFTKLTVVRCWFFIGTDLEEIHPIGFYSSTVNDC